MPGGGGAIQLLVRIYSPAGSGSYSQISVKPSKERSLLFIKCLFALNKIGILITLGDVWLDLSIKNETSLKPSL